MRIPSEIGDETQIADWTEAYLLNVLPPAHVARYGNAILAGHPEDHRPTLALFGHLDTVPAREDGPPRKDEHFVYGSGASDMKGGLAVMLALATDLDLLSLKYRPLFVFYDKEEGPFAESGLEPLFSEHADLFEGIDLAICLEPTDEQVHVGCVGTLHATVTFSGRRAHSARPWHGENAIHKAGPLLAELRDRAPVDVDVQGLLFREVVSATMAGQTGARNVVPDHFELNLNYRFAPGKSIEQAQADILALVDGKADVVFTDLCPSGRVCLDNGILQQFIDDTGFEIQAKQAWTDVARLGTHGIDAVNYGPGATAQAHQRNEKAPIGPLPIAYGALRNLLQGPG